MSRGRFEYGLRVLIEGFRAEIAREADCEATPGSEREAETG
ncbi:hypothetical protein [Kitasatospora sp. NPDC093806]